MWTKAIQISRLEQFNIFNCELENITNHNSFSKLNTELMIHKYRLKYYSEKNNTKTSK
jgi:hypothetical protein